jgi:biotin carboxyl carrier protein
MSLPRVALLLCLTGVVVPAMANPVTLPTRAVRFRPERRAWAQVKVIAPLVLRTAMAARVSEIRASPGQRVSAGEPLARLAGPQWLGQLAAAHARLRAAQLELAAARRSAASAKRTYPIVTNRRALDAAQAASAAAQDQLSEAQAKVTTLTALQWLSSPVPATVTEVSVAAGADLPAGASVVTLLPRGQRWLRAEWFGAASMSPPASGRFIPASGDPAIPVRLIAELPERAANGARVLNFAPTGPATWQAGEVGELVMRGAPESVVAVPAGALVLDAGKWYVLTDIDGRLAARHVTPGPAQGPDTLITAGLEPGVPVVVRDAYLLYHRDISAQYTPPD